MPKSTPKQLLLLATILALITLPSIFIWLEIGPLGKAFYGETVPDVYIFGAAITGKDTAFVAINVAYKFQLIVILFFAIASIISFKFIHNSTLVRVFAILNFILLALFPYWMFSYTDIVICNSDGAASDLTVHYGFGWIVYLVLLVVQIVLLFRLRKARLSNKN